jgi:hypothetical protein
MRHLIGTITRSLTEQLPLGLILFDTPQRPERHRRPRRLRRRDHRRDRAAVGLVDHTGWESAHKHGQSTNAARRHPAELERAI